MKINKMLLGFVATATLLFSACDEVINGSATI